MPRAGLTADRVVEAAADLADERGAISLSEIAERLGVKVPSLYKHVSGLDELRRQVALAGMRDLITELGAATVGRSGKDALRSAATAWRAYAKAHPGRYAAVQRAPDPADTDLAAVGERLVGLLLAVLHGYGLADDELVQATRAVRAALHGFVLLETAGGFGRPQDVDESYDGLVDVLDSGLRNR